MCPPVIDLPPPLVECTQNTTLGKLGNIVAKTLLPINVLLILGNIVAETKFASQNQKCFPTKSKIYFEGGTDWHKLCSISLRTDPGALLLCLCAEYYHIENDKHCFLCEP